MVELHCSLPKFANLNIDCIIFLQTETVLPFSLILYFICFIFIWDNITVSMEMFFDVGYMCLA